MGSDFEKKSASRRLSQEMWSSTREEGAPDGTGGGGFPYPAIAFVCGRAGLAGKVFSGCYERCALCRISSWLQL